MAAIINLLRPFIPILLQKESRNGLLVVLISTILSWYVLGYVDRKHEEVRTEMRTIDKEYRVAIKEENKILFDEMKSMRGEVKNLNRNVIQLYRDILVQRKHR
jgi:uncharacterized membrane protein (DUF106 family)